MVKRISHLLPLISITLCFSVQKDINLYKYFTESRQQFLFIDLKDITTHGFFESQDKNCIIKKREGSQENEQIKPEISNLIKSQSHLFSGHGHLFSFSQFNDSILNVIVTVPGHYSTPKAILLLINQKGKIVSEVPVASEFFDGGSGSLTRSFIKNRNTLKVIQKDLNERPLNVPCTAEIKEYKILENGQLRLIKTENKEIKCEI